MHVLNALTTRTLLVTALRIFVFMTFGQVCGLASDTGGGRGGGGGRLEGGEGGIEGGGGRGEEMSRLGIGQSPQITTEHRDKASSLSGYSHILFSSSIGSGSDGADSTSVSQTHFNLQHKQQQQSVVTNVEPLERTSRLRETRTAVSTEERRGERRKRSRRRRPGRELPSSHTVGREWEEPEDDEERVSSNTGHEWVSSDTGHEWVSSDTGQEWDSDDEWVSAEMEYISSSGRSEDDRWDLAELGVKGRRPELCDDARLQCTVRTGCQMALNNFFQGCHSVVTGEDQHCTRECKHALLSLLATEDGAGLAFVNCRCGGDEECQQRKERVEVCQRHVLDSMDLVRDDAQQSGGTPVSCSFARWLCEADTSCLAALRYYVHHCGKLFAGQRCTARCRNSIHILYRQPNAHKLRTCRCEGDEAYNCASLQHNTQRLCFHRHKQRHQHHQRHDDDKGTEVSSDSNRGNDSTHPEYDVHSLSQPTDLHHYDHTDYVSDGGDDDDDDYTGYYSDDYEEGRRSQRHYGRSSAAASCLVRFSQVWPCLQVMAMWYSCATLLRFV